MASAMEKRRERVKGLLQFGRCLKGKLDGRTVFRFTGESPRWMKVQKRPSESWLSEGWFSRNILDD